jgi:cellulose synthase/poly-beta-1,6-N-acetylglucosamine synthase-like glycosyltransferase
MSISFVGMIILILTTILFVVYGSLISFYWIGWNEFPDFTVRDQLMNTAISIIIPARNEEKNIAQVLQALEEQVYPGDLFEVIVIDDHSTDRTAEIVQQFEGVRLLQLKNDEINSYKKKAIEEGIAAAKNSFIITTDADCIPATNWLKTMACFKEENDSVFIAAPVSLTPNPSPGGEGSRMLTIFQVLDFLVLQGITAVSVHKKIFSMCNGANLGYEKKVFYQVDGFSSIDKIASGDDMLLMEKISKQYLQKVNYLKSKDAIVTTEPSGSWSEFFNQRLRWASKARHYDNIKIFAVQLLVYFFNLSFLLLLIASIWNYKFLFWFLALWLAKTIIEFPFVYSVASWFNQRSLMTLFFFFQPLHIAYTILVGFLAQFVKYEWKGRRVK